MKILNEQTCSACHAGAPQVTEDELAAGLVQLPEWKAVKENGIDHLTRTYPCKNFVNALQFTQAVGELAEEYNHHPALLTEWGKVTVSWWTHKIKGLHENDLIMAAKTEQLFKQKYS